MDRVKLDYTYTLADKRQYKNLLVLKDFEKVRKDIDRAHEQIKQEKQVNKDLSFLSLPYAYNKEFGTTILGDALWGVKEQIESKAIMINEKASDFIQIGIGGSALGTIALYNALGNELNAHSKQNLNIYLPDNIDPDWIGRILGSINMETTYFAVISKSGGTVETLANFAVFYEAAGKILTAEQLKEHFIIITNPGRGTLYELCKKEGFTLIPIPESIHGRFSVFSPGGLFPAAIMGIDIDELIRGARDMDIITEEKSFWENPLLIYSAIHYIANTTKGLSTLILIPYSHNLRTIADWYAQLIAESLGKDGKGMTPVKALGATDQHSQLQLYIDGPRNKLVTFFSIENFHRNIEITSVFPELAAFQHIAGHSLNELINIEQRATAISLYNNGIPGCTFIIPELSPYYLGQLLMLLEKVTCILGKLYGVNAFNQPAVEDSKKYTRALLGSDGTDAEQKRREIEHYSVTGNRKIV